MSYFAKPNFIVYDEWFDDDLKNIIPYDKNKKITNTSSIHEFFYEQSNYKVGASENNLQLEIKVNKKELFNKNDLEYSSAKNASLTNKKFQIFKEITKNKLKFNITNKIIYFLSIFGFVIILALILFFISQSKKNESTISNKSILFEKRF